MSALELAGGAAFLLFLGLASTAIGFVVSGFAASRSFAMIISAITSAAIWYAFWLLMWWGYDQGATQDMSKAEYLRVVVVFFIVLPAPMLLAAGALAGRYRIRRNSRRVT
jgi:hypothetical protein